MKRSAAFLLAGIVLPVSALAADYPARPMSQVSAFNWTGFYAGVHAGYGWNDIDGWFGGGQIGFNVQAPGNPLVWGIELDRAFSNIGDSATVAGVTAKTNADYFGTLRGRVGASVDRTLLYVTGGFAWARNEISVTALGVTVSDTQTHTGWTVGAGLEQDIGSGWSGKLEYLYADFGSENYFGALPSGDFDIHTVKLGLNYRFSY